MKTVLQSRIFIIASSIFAGCVVIVGISWGTLFAFEARVGDTIVSGVTVGSIPVGGLTKEEARMAISKGVEAFESVGVMFELGDDSAIMVPEVLSESGPSGSYVLYEFDVDASVEMAYAQGRGGNMITRAYNRHVLNKDEVVLPVVLEINHEKVEEFLVDHFDGQRLLVRETGFAIAQVKNGVEVRVAPGAAGRDVLYDHAIDRAVGQMKLLQSGAVMLSTKLIEPRISDDEVRSLIPKFEEVVVHPKLIFEWDEQKFEVLRSEYATWIGVGYDVYEDLTLVLNEDAVNLYLDKIAPALEVEARNAKFEVGENGRVGVFESSRDGLAIDREATLASIYEVFIESGLDAIPVVVVVAPPDIATGDVNDFGITELLATGRTNFSGSPSNRRNNIAYGIELIDGALIKPGEEFSTLGMLGDITEANGWKAELVIKGDETKPEAGGGLCQVSTTLFRATLNAGLPVTARRNHSYRVSYYEPPVGKDATIYSPAPDYRFVNDTGYHVLVKGWVEGDDAVFEFWGTNDGRTVEQTDPVVYNYVSPPEPKRIKTSDLPPGKLKCTEHAHAGASAYFDYKVTYPDGELKDERFTSKYRPWGEVCLVGATQEEIDEEEALKILEAEIEGFEVEEEG